MRSNPRIRTHFLSFNMKYRQLGKTGLQVSEIGFGGWAIGGSGYGPTKDVESLSALETAWEHGVHCYDTADTYGHGHSEELLARFLKGKPRDQIILASKVGWDFYHGGSKKNFDADYIRFACEQSLKRLRVDVIDLYQLHNPTLDLIRKGDIFRPLENLKREGKIRFIGVSIHTEDDGLAAMEHESVDTLQLIFNLMDQRMASKVFDEAKRKQVGLIVREPLACGLLSGKYQPNHQFPKEDHRRRWTKEKLSSDLEKVAVLKSKLPADLSLVRAALEFVLKFDEISTVIPGAKTQAQVLENLLATEEPMWHAVRRENVLDLGGNV